MRLRLLAALCGALGSGACSQEPVGRTLVAPGGYGFFNCVQLANQEKTLTDRNVALQRLMARAKEGPGGGVISAMTYSPEYESNLGQIYSVRETQKEKNCTPAPAAPSTLPAPSPRR